MEVLLSYTWPGNVRELENCIQHMVAINSGPLLHAEDLPSALQNFMIQKKAHYLMAAAVARPAGAPAVGTDSAVPMPESPDLDLSTLPGVVPLAVLERRAIMNALDYTKGDRAVAAHLLGIGRTTLYRKLKEYNLAG